MPVSISSIIISYSLISPFWWSKGGGNQDIKIDLEFIIDTDAFVGGEEGTVKYKNGINILIKIPLTIFRHSDGCSSTKRTLCNCDSSKFKYIAVICMKISQIDPFIVRCILISYTSLYFSWLYYVVVNDTILLTDWWWIPG